MVTQLRIYTINRGMLDAFVEAWKAGVYPLRLQHGYNIPAAWVNRDRNEFIWLLTYDGPEAFADKERAYYASSERITLDPDPRQYIAYANQHFITPVLP